MRNSAHLDTAENDKKNNLLQRMKALETDIKIEETLQKVRNVICSESTGIDSGKSINEENIMLIRKFVSLMHNNSSLFLAYILKAVELSEDDGNTWKEMSNSDEDNLTDKILAVIREWKDAEKIRQEAKYQEYKKLFE